MTDPQPGLWRDHPIRQHPTGWVCDCGTQPTMTAAVMWHVQQIQRIQLARIHAQDRYARLARRGRGYHPHSPRVSRMHTQYGRRHGRG